MAVVANSEFIFGEFEEGSRWLWHSEELKEKGIKADIIREEPFVEAQDSVQYKIYLMKWKQQRGNYTAEIEEITI